VSDTWPTASAAHLIAGQWRAGRGEILRSFNPARPSEVVAEGNSATAADVDDAVSAATAALRGWASTPIHDRAAVLAAAAAIIDHNADQWGLPQKKATTVYLRGGTARA